MHSYTYFVLSPSTNLVKIGQSSNVTARLKSLQTSCPDRLRLLCTTDDTQYQEHILHERFKPLRVIGEWFTFGKDIQTLIDRIIHPVGKPVLVQTDGGDFIALPHHFYPGSTCPCTECEGARQYLDAALAKFVQEGGDPLEF